MVPPFVDENDPMYYLQLNGEVAHKWREVYRQPRTAFQLLQRSILPLGYQLMASAEERVRRAMCIAFLQKSLFRPIVNKDREYISFIQPLRLL